MGHLLDKKEADIFSMWGVANLNNSFLMRGSSWPRPLDLARPSPGLSDTVHHGILTGNVSHVLDAGSDQEAQSVGEKGEKKPVKKN